MALCHTRQDHRRRNMWSAKDCKNSLASCTHRYLNWVLFLFFLLALLKIESWFISTFWQTVDHNLYNIVCWSIDALQTQMSGDSWKAGLWQQQNNHTNRNNHHMPPGPLVLAIDTTVPFICIMQMIPLNRNYYIFKQGSYAIVYVCIFWTPDPTYVSNECKEMCLIKSSERAFGMSLCYCCHWKHKL